MVTRSSVWWVTTIGAPHQGSAVADTLYAVTQATGTTPLATGIANALVSIISAISGAPRLPQNAEAALKSLSSAGSKAFNQRFPAGAQTSNCGSGAAVVNGVRYYSAGGTSVVTNPLDADSALAITSVLFLGKPTMTWRSAAPRAGARCCATTTDGTT